MLAPDVRKVAVELLRPPPGHRLDQAVITTYSLDLEALLALPLAVLSHADAGLEGLLAHPLLLVEALREASERLHVFVDHGAMAIPRSHRDLFSLLEPCVHPVCAPGKGAFHPKVWFARFVDEEGTPLIRVAVLSRNLTFDRSWDLALTTDGVPGARKVAASGPLARLLRALPGFATMGLPESLVEVLQGLAGEAHTTSFPSPQGFDGQVVFEALGLKGRTRKLWAPRTTALRVLAVSPFVSQGPCDQLAELTPDSFLVGRQDELDGLKHDPTPRFGEVLVLDDAAEGERIELEGEVGAPTGSRLSGLHAKALAFEHGHYVTWWVGSANLTDAAWRGQNVEVMARLDGRKGKKGGQSGQGIHRFLDAGFRSLCRPYERVERPSLSAEEQTARKALADGRKALVQADLRIRCVQGEEAWAWALEGEVALPEGVSVAMWPLTRPEQEAVALDLPVSLRLPKTALTAYVAFRLSSSDPRVFDERLARKLPAVGLPEDRAHDVLRSLIGSEAQLLRFLRALLGGLEGLVDSLDGTGGAGAWGASSEGLGGDTLLEDLVRAAATDPARLGPIQRLLDELAATEEGRALIPAGFLDTWHAVVEALEGPDAAP